MTYTIMVQMYDGGRIEAPLPDGAEWSHAREGLHEVRRRFAGLVARAEIHQHNNSNGDIT